LFLLFRGGKKRENMKKYLLLVEDETLWEKFKGMLKKDINTEIINLIKKKVETKDGKK